MHNLEVLGEQGNGPTLALFSSALTSAPLPLAPLIPTVTPTTAGTPRRPSQLTDTDPGQSAVRRTRVCELIYGRTDSLGDSNAAAPQSESTHPSNRGSPSRGATRAGPELTRMRSLGANVGAIRPNGFPRQANGCGQAGDDHASSRTDPDNAERLIQVSTDL
jgi:hypothetical protein